MSNRFESLNVYKEAHSLVLMIYKITKEFPNYENIGLASQIRRSAISVVANIVEGNARGHKKEFVQFLYLANGSLEETKYHILLARDLGYISLSVYNKLQDQAEKVGKMMSGLIKYWKSDKS